MVALRVLGMMNPDTTTLSVQLGGYMYSIGIKPDSVRGKYYCTLTTLKLHGVQRLQALPSFFGDAFMISQ